MECAVKKERHNEKNRNDNESQIFNMFSFLYKEYTNPPTRTGFTSTNE